MKIRVFIANGNYCRDYFVEIECDGQPHQGDFFSIPDEVLIQLTRLALQDKGSCAAHEQWIDKYPISGEYYMSFDDAFVVYEVTWHYDEQTNSMKCYVSLDCDARGNNCHSEKFDGNTFNFTEDFIGELRMNTEKHLSIKL